MNAYGQPATDLLFYYVGHGGFGEGDTFFLSVRATDEDDPLASSITAASRVGSSLPLIPREAD
jgi:hypothetical protein